ncbi:MAG TPA: hypothetical protein VIF15_16240 [Polyangiaceae bacterium]
MRRPALLVALGALLTAACARDAARPEVAAPSYFYAIAPPAQGSWTLRVEARFDRAPSDHLVAPEAAGVLREVSLLEGHAFRPVPRSGEAWVVPECRTSCTVGYEIDLAALATACRRMDCAHRVGDAVIGSASSWMLRPEPAGDAPVRIEVHGGDPRRMVTGLRRGAHGSYALRTHELGEASYTAFGEVREAKLDVPGATLDVALLGPPLAMGDDGARAWVKEAAGCVARLFGHFPVAATVFVVPVRGADEVVFGRVLSLAGASVALLFGSETRPESEHADWVTVHELFHLGTPSFVGEGHWLEEGLATYYEPILRTRAGWMSEADLWRHFAREMPRGLRKPGDPPSLEERDDIDSTYWGGALFALLADVRIREATRGARSLDDAMRAALAQLGDATHSATLADFLRVGDAATGTPVLTEVHAHDAMAGEPVDLEGLWRALGVGVNADGSVTLHDDAPMAAARRAIAGAPAGK